MSTKHGNKKNKGETIAELAHRHLNDQYHVTTDEELENARVEFLNEGDFESPENIKIDKETVFPPIPGEPVPVNNGSSDGKIKEELPSPYAILGS